MIFGIAIYKVAFGIVAITVIIAAIFTFKNGR
jgi:hypothetical protein